MKYEQYKFKFYLNASHAIYIRGKRGQEHPHSWEISIDTMKFKNDFIRFDHIENLIEQDISEFQDTSLNAQKTFETLNPTLENISLFFCRRIEEILNRNGWILLNVEVSETPARSYVINLADEDNLERQYAEMKKLGPRDEEKAQARHMANEILNIGD